LIHAREAALDELEPVLQQVRSLGVLRERRRGSFDSGLKVTLHFHEDPGGLYADLRLQSETQRLRVSTIKEQQVLLSTLSDGIQRAKDARAASRSRAGTKMES
jgi:hypothetical protein